MGMVRVVRDEWPWQSLTCLFPVAWKRVCYIWIDTLCGICRNKILDENDFTTWHQVMKLSLISDVLLNFIPGKPAYVFHWCPFLHNQHITSIRIQSLNNSQHIPVPWLFPRELTRNLDLFTSHFWTAEPCGFCLVGQINDHLFWQSCCPRPSAHGHGLLILDHKWPLIWESTTQRLDLVVKQIAF